MFKKILATVFVMMFCGGIVFAEELSIGEQLQKIPALKQGIAYSMKDNNLCYLSTVELLEWKGITLEGGFSSKDKAVAVVSYELLKLKDLGVNVPLLDLIEARVGIYGGYGNLNLTESFTQSGGNKADWGISLTLLDIKF